MIEKGAEIEVIEMGAEIEVIEERGDAVEMLGGLGDEGRKRGTLVSVSFHCHTDIRFGAGAEKGRKAIREERLGREIREMGR